MDWCVYVIECESGAWYTGVSTDVQRRFHQHATGKGAKYFRLDKPKRLVAVQVRTSRSDALKTEAGLKKLTHRAKAQWVRTNRWRG